MSKLYECPYCKEKAVEAVNACGSSSYFCNHCKKVVSRSVIEEQKKDEKN